MNTTQILLAALLASTFAPALADDEQSAATPHVLVVDTRELTRTAEAMRQQAMENVRVFSQFNNTQVLVRAKNIKGAPYSAEMVTEQQQNLADGNQIVTRQSTMSYRDGAGRTRQETRDTKGELQLVTIEDPVDGAVTMLHPHTKTATKINRKRELEIATAESLKAKASAEQARIEAREAGRLAAAAARAAAEKARAERVDRGDRADRGDHSERNVRIDRVDGKDVINVRVDQHSGEPINVRVEPNVGDLGSIQANVNLALAGAFGDMRWSNKSTSKDLGSKEIEGVKAEGKLRSYEIPAGQVGNRNPIVVSDETWFAPDLQVTVYSKHSDPRTGDRVFRLANLKREEPAPALFGVPADYTVKDTAINRVTVDKK